MRIRAFDYYAPETLGEALQKLDQWAPQVRLLAGGTDLVLAMKHKDVQPAKVLSLHRLTELDYIRQTGNRLHIGAMARHADLAADPLIRASVPIIAQASSLIGSRQIRNVATMGGNLANASPAADAAGPLLALDARVVVADGGGEQTLPLSDFFTGPGQTYLKPNQLIKEVIVELPPQPCSSCFLKLMRKKGIDLALVAVTIQARTDAGRQTLTHLAIALAGVAPTPLRAGAAEKLLAGLSLKDAATQIPAAARAAVDASSPISDVRASASYRQTIIDTYVRQGMSRVLEALLTGKPTDGGSLS